MNKINIQKAITLTNAIELKKEKISKLRDEMRDLLDEYWDIFNNLVDADNDFQNAIEHLKGGIASLSQYL